MAVVKEYTTKNGVKCRIHDDAYVNNTPEQNEAIKRNINRTIVQLIKEKAQREGANFNPAI